MKRATVRIKKRLLEERQKFVDELWLLLEVLTNPGRCAHVLEEPDPDAGKVVVLGPAEELRHAWLDFPWRVLESLVDAGCAYALLEEPGRCPVCGCDAELTPRLDITEHGKAVLEIYLGDMVPAGTHPAHVLVVPVLRKEVEDDEP